MPAPRSVSRLALLALASCATSITVPQLDVLNRSLEARTVLLEEGFSLYSPFDAEGTASYAKLIAEEIKRVAAALEAPAGKPVVAQLVAVVGGPGHTWRSEGGKLSGSGPIRLPPLHGLRGAADEEDFVVWVAPTMHFVTGPDGPEIRWRVREEMDRDTIRHEIAHVFLRRLGVRDKLWLTEGVAEEIESMVPEGANLRRQPLPAGIEIPPDLVEREGLVRRVLALAQDADKIAAGETPPDLEGRLLARALVRFALERRPGSCAEVVRWLDARRASEILALEEEFRAWLRSLPPPAPPGPG